jgi:hypothetical protein
MDGLFYEGTEESDLKGDCMFDKIKTAGARVFINKFIDGIGTVKDLEIDKKARTIIAQVEMVGEARPVRIEAAGYILGADFIAISRFICDKPWIEAALNRFLANKEIKIPEQARSAINLIM